MGESPRRRIAPNLARIRLQRIALRQGVIDVEFGQCSNSANSLKIQLDLLRARRVVRRFESA